MIPGKTIALGDREFVVPPLSLGQLRTGLAKKIEKHDKLINEEGTGFADTLLLRGEVIIAALRRNYSVEQFSDDDLWDRLDIGNTLTAWQAVLGLSGFDPVGEAEAVRVDELPATALVATTLPSPPLTDGIKASSIN